MAGLILPNDYDAFLKSLKERVRAAQLRASLAVNRELVMLYWGIGRDILARQKEQGWGARIIDRLAADLRQEFPQVRGFSPRNLKYMRAFAEAWPDESIVQQLAAQIPWFHNCAIQPSTRLLTKQGPQRRRETDFRWPSRGTAKREAEGGAEFFHSLGAEHRHTPAQMSLRHGDDVGQINSALAFHSVRLGQPDL